MKPYLSIVIPAYNEETNIRLGALDKVSLYLEKQAYTWEVIVVNDGSDDATSQVVEEFILVNKGFWLIDNPHRGKAATVISGINQARGEIVLFTDLDQATPLKEVEKVLPHFEKGADVVIGSREGRRTGAPLTRKIMGRGYMMLRSVILGLAHITDTQCGFKAFRRSVAVDIFKRLRLYGNTQIICGSKVTAGFDIEVLFIARKLGYKIVEVPVEWHYVETRRVNPLKDSWEGFMDIIKIRLNAWRGEYSTDK